MWLSSSAWVSSNCKSAGMASINQSMRCCWLLGFSFGGILFLIWPNLTMNWSTVSSSALVIWTNYRFTVLSVRLGAPPEQIYKGLPWRDGSIRQRMKPVFRLSSEPFCKQPATHILLSYSKYVKSPPDHQLLFIRVLWRHYQYARPLTA